MTRTPVTTPQTRGRGVCARLHTHRSTRARRGRRSVIRIAYSNTSLRASADLRTSSDATVTLTLIMASSRAWSGSESSRGGAAASRAVRGGESEWRASDRHAKERRAATAGTGLLGAIAHSCAGATALVRRPTCKFTRLYREICPSPTSATHASETHIDLSPTFLVSACARKVKSTDQRGSPCGYRRRS
jgi:hypothetical protein